MRQCSPSSHASDVGTRSPSRGTWQSRDSPFARAKRAREGPLCDLRQRIPQGSEHFVKPAFDAPRLHAKCAHAVHGEVLVPKGIVGLTPAMSPAIDFNRELRFGNVEVDDGVCEDDLAPNLDAKLPFSQRLPKDALRGGGMPTRVLRARREESAFMTKSGKSPTRHGLQRDTHGSACGRVGLPLVVRFAASRGGEERRGVSQQKAHVDLRAGEWAGFEPKGAGSVTAARAASRRSRCRWRGGCATARRRPTRRLGGQGLRWVTRSGGPSAFCTPG